MRVVRALIHKPITIMVNRRLRHCYCRGSWGSVLFYKVDVVFVHAFGLNCVDLDRRQIEFVQYVGFEGDFLGGVTR
jgi:hypothetical protein